MYRCFKKIIVFLFCGFVFVCAQNLEDDKIFEALSFIDVGDYKSAIEIYNEIYDSTNKLEYLEEVIRLSMAIGDTSNALSYIKQYQKINNKNLRIKYILANIYMMQKSTNEAILAYEDIIKFEKEDFINKMNFKNLGGLYALKKEYKIARKYLMQSYAIEQELHTLLLITSADIALGDFNSSVPLIEDYFKESIDSDFAQIIIQLSFEAKNTKELESLFDSYYKKYPNKINANNLFLVYVIDGKLDSALSLADEYDLNLEIVVDKYLFLKDYKNARAILKKLMDKKDDSFYYGILAIIDFEEAQDKESILDSVIKNFQIALKDDDNPTFANYLGYLLIDYDIDINEGINYVKNALNIEPNNPAFLDSLAWGYYKLNQCEESLEIMNKIDKEILESEKEIKEHLEQIRKCLK